MKIFQKRDKDELDALTPKEIVSKLDEYIVGQIEAGELKLDDLLGDIESRCIRIALEKYNNNISKAAEALHVNRTTLYSRVQKLGHS